MRCEPADDYRHADDLAVVRDRKSVRLVSSARARIARCRYQSSSTAAFLRAATVDDRPGFAPAMGLHAHRRDGKSLRTRSDRRKKTGWRFLHGPRTSPDSFLDTTADGVRWSCVIAITFKRRPTMVNNQ
jgi:hypothetical protein